MSEDEESKEKYKELREELVSGEKELESLERDEIDLLRRYGTSDPRLLSDVALDQVINGNVLYKDEIRREAKWEETQRMMEDDPRPGYY